MKKIVQVLISNVGLPFHGIGSWTYEINYFLRNNPIIDIVLSPTSVPDNRFIYCEKKSWPRFSKFGQRYILKNYVARDYLAALRRLSIHDNPLSVLVIDDQALLEAVLSIKTELPKYSQVIFYYHGHALKISPSFQDGIDQIFFLTQKGYLDSLIINERFTPEVKIIGNGIDSSVFYPLSIASKNSARELLGFKKDDLIISWMANERPVKGLHLFQKLIPKLLALPYNLKILIIGNKQEFENTDRVFYTGMLSANKVANYLQISDFYFFTSLWKEGFGLSLGEAIKCGNFVVTSDNGGITEVIGSYKRAKIVALPNVVDDWVNTFIRILQEDKWNVEVDDFAYSEFQSLQNWEKRLVDAL